MDSNIKYELEQIKLLYETNAITEIEYNLLKYEILFGKKSQSINEKPKISSSTSNNLNRTERNVFNEIKSNNKINKKSSNKNDKSNKLQNILLFTIGFILFAFFMLKHSADENEIIEKCSDCNKFEKIRKTKWILVSRNDKKSNVYDTESNDFLLDNWYEAKYDEGAIYDDITFEVNGSSKICSEDEYHYLSEQGDDYLDGSFKTAEDIKKEERYQENKEKENHRSWVVCKNCPGKSCSRCFGRMYYYGKEN